MSFKKQDFSKRLAAIYLVMFCLCTGGFPVRAAEGTSHATAQQQQSQVTVTVLDE